MKKFSSKIIESILNTLIHLEDCLGCLLDCLGCLLDCPGCFLDCLLG